MSYEDIEGKMFFAKPRDSKLFHIFRLDKRSLCGRVMMPFFNPDEDDYITGDEDCIKGDCKKCFDKMKKIKHPICPDCGLCSVCGDCLKYGCGLNNKSTSIPKTLKKNNIHPTKQTVQTGSCDNPSVSEIELSGSQRRVKTGDSILKQNGN